MPTVTPAEYERDKVIRRAFHALIRSVRTNGRLVGFDSRTLDNAANALRMMTRDARNNRRKGGR